MPASKNWGLSLVATAAALMASCGGPQNEPVPSAPKLAFGHTPPIEPVEIPQQIALATDTSEAKIKGVTVDLSIEKSAFESMPAMKSMNPGPPPVEVKASINLPPGFPADEIDQNESITMRIPNFRVMGTFVGMFTPHIEYGTEVYVPNSLATADVYLGIPAGPWHTEGAYSAKLKTHTGLDFGPVIFKPQFAPTVGVKVRLTPEMREDFVRIVAFDTKGTKLGFFGEFPSNTEGGGPAVPKDQAKTMEFERSHDIGKPAPSTDVSDVGKIELQTQPITWIEFKNVLLKPAS